MTDVLRPVVNVFSFVDDLQAATAWYTARLGAPPAVTGTSDVVLAEAVATSHSRLPLRGVRRVCEDGGNGRGVPVRRQAGP
jgi:hypothetical protein